MPILSKKQTHAWEHCLRIGCQQMWYKQMKRGFILEAAISRENRRNKWARHVGFLNRTKESHNMLSRFCPHCFLLALSKVQQSHYLQAPHVHGAMRWHDIHARQVSEVVMRLCRGGVVLSLQGNFHVHDHQIEENHHEPPYVLLEGTDSHFNSKEMFTCSADVTELH